MRTKILTKRKIFSIILIGITVLFANADETERFYPTNMDFIGMTKNTEVYSKQVATSTKEFFVGYNGPTFTYGRGYLTFDLTKIPKGAKIKSASLQLSSLIKWDSNFAKDKDIVIRQTALFVFPDNVSWKHLGGGPEIARVKYENEGIGKEIKSNYLTALVSDNIGSKIYMSIHLADEGKVIRFSTEQNFLHLKVVYTTESEPSIPSIIPKQAAITVKNTSANSVNFTWEDVKADYYDYNIKTNNQTIISKQKVTHGSFITNGLQPDTKYNLSVDAFFLLSSGGYSIKTSTKEFITKPKIPSSPQNIKAEITVDSWEKNFRGCLITFDQVTGSNWDVDYIIYELNYPLDGTYKTKYAGSQYGENKNTHLIKNLDYGKTYYFGISAVNISGQGTWGVVSITTPITTKLVKPVTPTSFNYITMGAVNQKVLIWSYPDAEKNNITGFMIRQTIPNAETYIIPASQRSYYLGYLTSLGNPYVYTITAINGTLRSEQLSTGFQITGGTRSTVIEDRKEDYEISTIDNKLLIKGIYENYSLRVFDLSGRLMISNLNVRGNEIDISSLTKGVYIMHLITEKKTITEKIIKK